MSDIPTYACRGGRFFADGMEFEPLERLVEQHGEIERLTTELAEARAYSTILTRTIEIRQREIDILKQRKTKNADHD